MKKTTKSFIVSSSIILLITGTTVPSLFSLADVIDADKITSASSSNTKNEQPVTSKETSNSIQEIDSTVQPVTEKKR